MSKEELKDLSKLVINKEVEITEEDSEEDAFVEKLIQNGRITGMLYVESKPVVLEKYQNGKAIFGLIIDMEGIKGKNVELTEKGIINKCKRVCERRTKEMIEEHDAKNMGF